ncbi:MAG: CHRD domain-containing protein [Chitinophagaceae bacterium]|nr:CHRD domain-containing protein [Rubrivivax sp.]
MTKKLCVALATMLACLGAQANGASVFSATLLGSNEVGLPGDPDGIGVASAVIDSHTGQVDWSITFANLSTVVGAHIHTGVAGTNGPIIVNFAVPTGLSGNGSFSGSLIDPDAMGITDFTAANFYFNVHTSQFPGGAIRGQLAAVPEPGSYALMLAGLAAVGGISRRMAQRRMD